MIKAFCGRMLGSVLTQVTLVRFREDKLWADYRFIKSGKTGFVILWDPYIQTYLRIKHDRFSISVQQNISVVTLVMINCRSHTVYMGVLMYAAGSFEVGSLKQLPADFDSHLTFNFWAHRKIKSRYTMFKGVYCDCCLFFP